MSRHRDPSTASRLACYCCRGSREYLEALTQAAAQLNLRVFYFEKNNVLELAAQARGKTARDFERQLEALGTALGPPWRKGHVVACAAAILAHVSAALSKPKKPRQKGRA